MTTSEVAMTTDLYASDFKAIEFIGPTDQALFAAVAEWLADHENVILRAVTYDFYARTDENDYGLTVIYEPI